jgi:hypothetical protein
MKGYIYIMTYGDRCKVGLSIDPVKRLSQLKNAACPDLKLAEIYSVENMPYSESAAHQALKNEGLHIKGEVFSGELKAVREIVRKTLSAETTIQCSSVTNPTITDRPEGRIYSGESYHRTRLWG